MAASIVRGVRVTNLLAGRRFLVEWTLNDSSESITTYDVYRSTTESGDRGGHGTYIKMGSVTSPNRQYIDLVPFTYGVVYYYKVVAVSSAGVVGDLSTSLPVSDMTFDSFEEEPFRPTTVRFDSFATGEIPVGVINSSNLTFTLSSLFRFNSTAVYLSGVRKTRGVDYTEGNDQRTIVFVTAPATGAVLTVDYLKV